MKKQIAEKKIYNDYSKDRIFVFAYCDIYYIEKVLEECTQVYYNAGLFGWNFNAYYLKDLALITGYRFVRKKDNNIEIENKILELEQYLKNNYKYDNRKEMINYTMDVLNNLFK